VLSSSLVIQLASVAAPTFFKCQHSISPWTLATTTTDIMKKLSLFIFLSIMTSSLFSQTAKFLVDARVAFIKYQGDSIEIDNPKMFTVNTNKCTEIFSLGKTKLYEIGMRVEILSSELSGKTGFIVGKAYYIKKNGQWEVIVKFDHAEEIISPISSRQKPSKSDYIIGGASTEEPIFKVRLRDDYYVTK
jgi:hypothetical protein